MAQEREEVENRVAEIEENQESIIEKIRLQNDTDQFIADVSEDIEQLKAHIKAVELKWQEKTERFVEVDSFKQMTNSYITEKLRGWEGFI